MANIYFEKLNDHICSVAKKPEPAKMSVASWWKFMDKFNYELDSDFPKNIPHKSYTTARSCPALNDAINFGYTLYNPLDVYIDASDDEQITWRVPDINLSIDGQNHQSFIGFHHKDEMPGYQKDESFHDHVLKLNTFFGIKTDPGYSCWITHPVGRLDLPYRIFDAVVDTDKYVSRFPCAFFIKRGFNGVIKSGTPLIQIIPFRREPFKCEIIEKDENDIKQNREKVNTYFTNSYKKLFWIRKKFD